MRFRKVVAIDFDGVIHRHVAPWTKPHEINDGPVEGVFEFMDQVLREFDIVVFSARAADARACEAMSQWLVKHWATVASVGWHSFIGHDEDAMLARFVHLPSRTVRAQVTITARKPQAFLYIDDRGWRFDGTTFPSMDELRTFAAYDSWTRKERAS